MKAHKAIRLTSLHVAGGCAAVAMVAVSVLTGPALAYADDHVVEEHPLSAPSATGGDVAAPGVPVDTSTPAVGLSELAAQLLPKDWFPDSYTVSDLAERDAEEALHKLAGTLPNSRVLPGRCVPEDELLDPSNTVVRVAEAQQTGTQILLTLAKAEAAEAAAGQESLTPAEDVAVPSWVERVESCGYFSTLVGTRFTEVETTLQPPPMTMADQSYAYTRRVVVGDQESIGTRHMVTFVATVGGYRVTATALGELGYAPDPASLDNIFSSAVQKLAEAPALR